MKKEEKNKILKQIIELKKDLMLMRIKKSSGETLPAKDFKIKKKQIARLFTQFNVT